MSKYSSLSRNEASQLAEVRPYISFSASDVSHSGKDAKLQEFLSANKNIIRKSVK